MSQFFFFYHNSLLFYHNKMNNRYKLKNYKKKPSLKYFADNRISEWSFKKFEASFNKNKTIPVNTAKIKNTYLTNMKNIQDLNDVPDFVKMEARRLLTLSESPETKPQIIRYNITGDNSNIINILGTVSINSNQQPQSSPKRKYRQIANIYDFCIYFAYLSYSIKRSDDDNSDKIPSDFDAILCGGSYKMKHLRV